jgi:hypothetical protein
MSIPIKNPTAKRESTGRIKFPTDTAYLLLQAANTVSDALSSDHVLVFESGFGDTKLGVFGNIGWKDAEATEVAADAGNWLQRSNAADVDGSSAAVTGKWGEIAIVLPAHARKLGVTSGLVARISGEQAFFTILAARSVDRTAFDYIDARFLLAVLQILNLTISRGWPRPEMAEP